MKIMQTFFQKGSHISSLVPELDGRLRLTLSQDWLNFSTDSSCKGHLQFVPYKTACKERHVR